MSIKSFSNLSSGSSRSARSKIVSLEEGVMGISLLSEGSAMGNLLPQTMLRHETKRKVEKTTLIDEIMMK